MNPDKVKNVTDMIEAKFTSLSSANLIDHREELGSIFSELCALSNRLSSVVLGDLTYSTVESI